MSQEINNREYRKEVLKNLLRKLHSGQTVDDVKQEFEQAFGAKDCHVLLEFDPKSSDSAQAFNKPGRREHCANITGRAAEMAARIIMESSAK